tara:strand:+ start:1047 stop:1625 length:579 start_codon:yes stop_codon:yes gene_type:complete
MSTFIERMQVLANDKDAVQKTFSDEYEEKREVRKDRLFKTLTYKYYDEIKNVIENASKHGRQYAYMNFNRDDFKANFNGLGNPAQVQRQWLTELCNPESKYLTLNTWGDFNTTSNWFSAGASSLVYPKHTPSSSPSVFSHSMTIKKRDSFKGLNFDVWNNVKFTTVFSWDLTIGKDSMTHYYTKNWQQEEYN